MEDFLRQSKSVEWDREVPNGGFSWLGWTVLHGTTEDIVAIIKSKQPYDPLLGMLDLNMLSHFLFYITLKDSLRILNLLFDLNELLIMIVWSH